MVQIFILHPQGGRAESRLARRLRAILLGVRHAIDQARQDFRRLRMEAELRRKLEGVDDHLLRDIGLTREGDRLERLDARRGVWDGGGADR